MLCAFVGNSRVGKGPPGLLLCSIHVGGQTTAGFDTGHLASPVLFCFRTTQSFPEFPHGKPWETACQQAGSIDFLQNLVKSSLQGFSLCFMSDSLGYMALRMFPPLSSASRVSQLLQYLSYGK